MTSNSCGSCCGHTSSDSRTRRIRICPPSTKRWQSRWHSPIRPMRICALTDALVFARQYTVELLDTIPLTDWFKVPAGCPSHIAWQVGHLAMAETRLVYCRVCGRMEEEESILPKPFGTLYGRRSVPEPNPEKNPSA